MKTLSKYPAFVALTLALALVPMTYAAGATPLSTPRDRPAAVQFPPQTYTVSATAETPALERSSYAVHLTPRLSEPLPPTPVSSGWGPRTCNDGPCSTFHHGMDFAAASGTEIRAVADGTVTFAGEDGDYGNKIVIDHDVAGDVFTTVYGHLLDDSTYVTTGQTVRRGELIGLVGDTGQSYGAHLHFEVRIPGTGPVDPQAWLAARDVLPFPG